VTQPPYGLPPDRPQDTPRSFPTYGRPESQQHAQQQAQQPGAQASYGQSSSQAPWVAPGQPQQPGPAPYGQPQYGYAPPAYPPPGNWPTPYGYGYPAAAGSGTNGLATAALICGAGGFIVGNTAPVAIGLGIAALVQIRNRQQDGKGMAIAGLVLGAVVTLGYALLIALLVALGSTTDDEYYGAPEPSSSYSSNTVYVDDLVVGNCFDEGDEEDEAIRKPCAEPHDAEIIAEVTLPAGPYPGDQGVDSAAEKNCGTEFGGYVGKSVQDSELEPGWWTPTRDLWDHNDRVVICAAYGPEYDLLTGSVKGTRR
jgi:hypothetical protein